jgi:thiamine kinase-like enzyme
MQKEEIQQTLSQAFGMNVKRLKMVQSLWSGYGAIVRYWTFKNQQPLIAKIINIHAIPQHPRGWSGETSHQRKLSSFVNEQRFYQGYGSVLFNIARVPQYLDAIHTDDAMVLLLADVDAQGFAKRVSHPTADELWQCLAWLAQLHAFFLQQGVPTTLWQRGNYWHLATRADEYQKMADGELKQKAHALDDALAQAQYQTLLHGDAKIANFCFSDDACLALDFQYVGAGVGVVDVMYFLGSCMNEHDLEGGGDAAFDYYFDMLKAALTQDYVHQHWTSLETEWRALIPVAWADFSRFLAGWSPSHHKLHGYSARQTQWGLSLVK